MKKAIYYALVSGHWYGDRLRIVAATKGGETRVYGRDLSYKDARPTNWLVREERGRFNTKEEAEAAIPSAEEEIKPFRERLRRASEEERAARNALDYELARFLREASTYKPEGEA